MRPTELWTLFDQQVNTTIACRNFSRVVQRVLLRISKAVIKAEAEPDGDARADVGAPAVVPDGVWRPLGVFGCFAGSGSSSEMVWRCGGEVDPFLVLASYV